MQERWPELRSPKLRDTTSTIHLWLQVIGKIRLALSPHVNHWWQATTYVTARGLTSSPIPAGRASFTLDLDFVDHQLRAACSDGGARSFALRPGPVSEFYAETFATLRDLGVDVSIWPVPVEIDDRTPLDEDARPRAYDPEQATRYWSALVAMERVFQAFRSRFIGKVSPVHVFWGAFDLAVTRFSGRRAPAHPGAPNLARWVAREAYSHEVSSCGFWSGAPMLDAPAFYAYAYPEPPGFASHPIAPADAYFHPQMGEFLLPYESVRLSADPDATLMQFLQSTYEAAAIAADWDRAALERQSDDLRSR